MDKKKVICCIGATILIVILIVAPVVIGRPMMSLKQNIVTSVRPLESDDSICIGEMYIVGTGHFESSSALATAEQNPEIKVKRDGSDLTFRADYILQCTGDWDYGMAMLSVGGEATVDHFTQDSYDEGSLYVTIYDCKPGDFIMWILYVEYGDLFFPRALKDFKGGGTICSLKIFNIVQQQIPDLQKIISGTIVCK